VPAAHRIEEGLMSSVVKPFMYLCALITLFPLSAVGGTPVTPSGFTEIFGTGETNDLDYKTVTFTPEVSDEEYTACIQPATQFLTDPTGGTVLSLADDGNIGVTSTMGQVVLFGLSFSNFFIASNGYITFGASHNLYEESAAVHFGFQQVSLLFDDFNPVAGGTISWRDLTDRVAVTYESISEFTNATVNSMQVELFFDGRIRMTWLDIAAEDGLIGLSSGAGLPAPFTETDVSVLSACPTFIATPFEPDHADINVPPNSPVLMDFSAQFVDSTVNSTSFKVWGKQTGFYSGLYDFTACSQCGDFIPSAFFKPGEEVFVMLNSGIISDGGLVLKPHQYQFTAAAVGCSNFVFHESSRLPPDDTTAAVALGDVDSDGDLDLAVANRDAIFRSTLIYLNDGDGNFSDSGQKLETNNMHAVAFGDLDSDSDLDLVIGKSVGGARVFMNDGVGVFSNSYQSLGSAANSVVLGDVDGDGDLDLIKGSSSSDPGRLYLNDGSGVFADSGQTVSTNATMSMALGDIDNDGDLDLATGNDSGEAEKVHLNDGSGVFSDSGQLLGEGFTQSIALGDVDGDNDLDLVTVDFNGQDAVYLNNGSGVFANSGQMLGGEGTFGMALGDVDGDGDLDIVKANFLNQPTRVFLNDGLGIFANSGMAIGGPMIVRSVVLGDVDGDLDLDIVTGNYNSQVRVFKNFHCLDTGDYDGDGLPNNVELDISLSPTNAADASADDDMDQQSVLEEYIAGTQWTNGASYFHCENILKDNGNLYLILNAISGRVYTVEDSSLLTGLQAWSYYSGYSAETSSEVLFYISELGTNFFRVRVSLP